MQIPTSHTPGPWYVGERAASGIDVRAVDSRDLLAQACIGRLNCEANARLIAAAPDLLEACKQLYEYMPTLTALQRRIAAEAEQAIAKAEGRP